MGAKGQEGLNFVRVLGWVAVSVNSGHGGQLFTLSLELLHSAHGTGGGCPVDTERKANGILSGKTPAVRVGAEGWRFAAKGDDLGEGGGAVSVGDVTTLGSIDDVASTPEVVKAVIHADDADPVLVSELNGAVEGLDGD